MSFLIGLALKAGIPDRFAKVAVFIAGALLLVGLLGGAKCAYDSRIIERHDDKRAVKVERADRKADASAAVQRQLDDRRIAQEAAQLEKVQANAPTDLDRRLAKHRCLRSQQAARRDGKQPPACA